MNHQHGKAARRMRAKLRALFPKCFRGRGQLKWPLKLDIGADIAQRCPELPYHDVALALADYTMGRHYLVALQAGAIRRDLDGKPAGTVSAGAAAKAATQLARQEDNNARQAGASAPAGPAGQAAGA